VEKKIGKLLKLNLVFHIFKKMVEVFLFRKSKTPEEKEVKLVFGICVLLTFILMFIFSDFLKKIQGYSIITDVALIIFIVCIPLYFLVFYLWIRRIKNG